MKKRLETIYKVLSALQVSGDAVDIMAAVRQELRLAIEEAGKEEDDGRQDDR